MLRMIRDSKAVLLWAAGTLLVGWLFYNRLPGLIPAAFAGAYIAGVYLRYADRRRQKRRREQFRRLLLSIETALEAGYSLENALSVARNDLALVYSEKEEICVFAAEFGRKTTLGAPVWQVFREYADQVEIEEAEEFSQVLRIQQRTGGDLIRTVRRAAARLQESLELQQEIEKTLSEKLLEQRIMSLMPSFMLIYMRLMNGTYLTPLYQGLGGAVIMTFALALNIAADMLADRMLRKVLGGYG